MTGAELKKKVMKFRKKAFDKLMKAYEIKELEKEVKICSRHGEHYIIIDEKYCWKEVLNFEGNTFHYSLVPYQEFFELPKAEAPRE